MRNDWGDLYHILQKMQNEMDGLSKMFRPSALDLYKQMDQSFNPIRQRHLELAKTIESSSLACAQLADILHANNHWQRLIDQVGTSTGLLGDLKDVHQTWLDILKSEDSNLIQLQATTRLSLINVTHRLTFTEEILSGMNLETLKSKVGLPEANFVKLQDEISRFFSIYENLASSIQTYPEMAYLPAFILSGATREIFTNVNALDEICNEDEPEGERESSKNQLIEEVKQETSGCLELLSRLDPALIRPYIGAHQAFQSGSVDRTRHVFSSLRELWNHLLRRLAPDEDVLSWANPDNQELIFKGRPTRRARALYVCRGINDKTLSDFVDNDTKALVGLIEVFSRVHELESEVTNEQINALLLRTDSWITYILQIWKESK